MTTAPTARVRGIYTTALTRMLSDAGITVVDASGPIDRRFGQAFPETLPEVCLTGTEDREGIEIRGDLSGVERVGEVIDSVSRDTLTWNAAHPPGAIFVGHVDRTGDSGAIVDIGNGEAFLPYGRSDDYIESGDRRLVQVIDPEPPWSVQRRPVVTTRAFVPGVYVDLVFDEENERSIEAPHEEARKFIELVLPELPRGWVVEASHATEAANISALEADLERAVARIEPVRAGRETVDDMETPRLVETILHAQWSRVGREGRFALDDARRNVTPTVDGHHRIKSISAGAGRAVDLLERLDVDAPEFEADAVIETFGPRPGDGIRIDHGKPNGRTIVLGRADVTEQPREAAIAVERELSGGGTLDALGVPKESGDVAETTFVEGAWWYPTVYRDEDGRWKGTYVNVGTPLEILPDRVRYVDLFVDVVKTRDGSVEIVDEEELADAVAEGLVSDALASRAKEVASAVKQSME